MVHIDKKQSKKTSTWVACLILVVTLSLVILIAVNNGSTSDEVKINSTENVSGIRCKDVNKTSIFLKDYVPVSHINTVTVAFIKDKLSSITFSYEGKYRDAAEADHARDFAETAYNTILPEKYGLEITDFTKNISVKEDTVHLSITTTDAKNLKSITAPIFMLENDKTFPTTLEAMRVAYENEGFKCEINN